MKSDGILGEAPQIYCPDGGQQENKDPTVNPQACSALVLDNN